jgi:hypothetical protein
MDRNQLSVDELRVNKIIGASQGLPTPGNKIYLDPTKGSDGNDNNEASPVKTFKTGYAAMTTLKNDIMYIYPGSSGVSLAATDLLSTATYPDITKSLCSFVGTSMGKMSQRARIGMAAAFTPMLTVSGYGNNFANLYFQHGTGTADLVGLSITGNYNSFYNCHIATPLFAALGNQNGYKGLSIVATGTYFKECVIGMNTIARTGAYPTVYINAPSNHYGYTRFDDCTFLMQGNTAPFHFVIDNTAADQDETYIEFNRCRFISTGQNMPAGPTYSFSFTATAAQGCTCGVFIDAATQFVNCGIVTSNNYANVWVATPGVAAATTHLAGVSVIAA